MLHAQTDIGGTETKSWGEHKYTYTYALYLRCQNLNGYLKIAVFTTKDMKRGIKKPRFEIFINPKADEYITREWVKGKEEWRTAMIENLNFDNSGCSYLYYESKKPAWMNREGTETIKSVLNVKEGGFKGILEYQRKIRKEKLEDKYRREVAPWDEEMKLIPDVPKDFQTWLEKKGIDEHFIFYQYVENKKITEGYCSYCEKMVPIEKPRHNKKEKCRCCKNKITFKAMGKIRRLSTEGYTLKLIQPIKEGFAVRTFEAYKTYSNTTYEKPQYIYKEYKRILYRENNVVKYTMDNYKQREYRWVRQGIIFNYHYGDYKCRTYTANMNRLAKNELKHSALPIMVKKDKKLDVDEYLYIEKHNPAIEKLVKINMFRLANELIEEKYNHKLFCEDANDLAKMLKIDKNRLSRLKALKGGICHLLWMQEEKKQNTIWSDEMICFFADQKIDTEDLEFVSDKMTYQKIENYIKRQQEISNDSVRQVITTWKDYLNMANKAKMPIKTEMVYKPKNLIEKHAQVIEILQQEGFKEQAKKVRERFKDVDAVCAELEKYEYADEKYTILAPKGVEDIIREGTILQHCVHTCDFYWDRICQRETYLLFLRKTAAKEAPYYTLEVEPSGNIRQKRTTGDNQNKDFDDAIGFLKKWQKEIQKRLSEEDKELGKKSNELRNQEYAKLRKDGNKVWHGKLAGRLLADVLEEDFMEVM